MEERLSVDTPESVSFGYLIAGVGSRFIAALIDMVILTLVVIALFCSVGALSNVIYTNLGSGVGTLVVALSILIIFGLTWGYHILFELAWNGQTPGKRMTGLRVIRTDGTPITVVDSLIRNLVRVIDFMPLYYAIGLVTMFLNDQSRRLGDLAAGTLVVRERRDVTLESLQPQAPRPRPSDHATCDRPPLSQDDERLTQSFLARRHELRNRAALALRIATAIAEKHDLPPPTSPREAEALLLQLVHQDPKEP